MLNFSLLLSFFMFRSVNIFLFRLQICLAPLWLGLLINFHVQAARTSAQVHCMTLKLQAHVLHSAETLTCLLA